MNPVSRKAAQDPAQACASQDLYQLHATCVSINGKGVLLLGPSGSGKSDIALRLVDDGAMLVADDRVDILRVCHAALVAASPQNSMETPQQVRGDNYLLASAPENLRGMLEVRGVGIVRLPYSEQVPLSLAVELVARDKVERLPEPKVWDCLGVQLPLLSLYAFDISVCAKIRITCL